MELATHPYQEGFIMDRGDCSPDIIAPEVPRKPSLTNNFSYPRSEAQLRRHESNNSRSSLISNGSVPGMTDSSDSETSFDEDSNYNTSASELWNTFWEQDGGIAPDEQYPVLLKAPHAPHCAPKNLTIRESNQTDDTRIVSKPESVTQITDSSETPISQHSPSRSTAKNGPSTYSIYPKPELSNSPPAWLPPRVSSLQTRPLQLTQRRALKPAKSSVNLKSSKSAHNLQPQQSIPPVFKMPFQSTSTNCVPAAPSYPPPPPPTRALRGAASAINLRDKKSSLDQMHHNIAVPLPPLSPLVASPTSGSPSQASSRPDFERYVSVFEFDSDHESYMESNSFTKRIARGFHKKSASEKRSTERRASADSEAHGSDKEKRKRGGSLGRILGLKGR